MLSGLWALKRVDRQLRDPHKSLLSLMYSGHRFWKLISNLATFPLGSSLSSLTQQRGDEPECEDVQGSVRELQDLTDGAVQLVGTEGRQVLHCQGHHTVICQIHQHISSCNGSQAGSAGPVLRHRHVPLGLQPPLYTLG